MSGKPSNSKPLARPYWVSARIRAATRSMLLETARDLIERNGEAALTLSAVADEAGLAHATIYGYFSGKRDLLVALEQAPARPEPEAPVKAPATPVQPAVEPAVATRTADRPEPAKESRLPGPPEAEAAQPFGMRHEILPAAVDAAFGEDKFTPIVPQFDENPVGGHVAPAASGMGEPAAAGEHSTEALAHDDSSEHGSPAAHGSEDPREAMGGGTELSTPEPEEPHELLTPYERERRQQATHLDEIAKRLILPEGALKQGTDAMISRLETRMKVLERSIANLETRHKSLADEGDRKLKPVSSLVTQLQARADASEDRLRHALAELRLNIHELKARQDTLDGGSRSAVAEMPAAAEPVAEEAPEEPHIPEPAEEPLVAEAEAPAAETEDEVTQEENSRLAYLSAVRNSAKEGARQAAEREFALEEEQNTRRKRLLTAAGVAVACLVVLGVLFRFHPGSHGVPAAQSKAMAPAAVRAAPRMAQMADSRAPLDRLTALANKGDARAELVIGLKYLKGDGIAANDAEAARWLERAAHAGDAIAQNHLGALYQTGRGVKADVSQAMHWYQTAALQGDRHAMSNLAVLYAGGAGTKADFAEAARWFQRSASLGYVDAQFNLAVLFERGDGVPQSLLDAYKWYSIAAASGDAVAKTRAGAIATQVSPEELQAAQQAVARFKPLPMNPAANGEPTMAQVLAAR